MAKGEKKKIQLTAHGDLKQNLCRWRCGSFNIYQLNYKSELPEAGFDLAAAVDVTFVLHGQRQVPQVVEADAGVV